MANYSIVEYLGGSNDGKCGYCKQEGNYNSHGFWAHSLDVYDYQALINRNWRRSGQYCYLPHNKDTCCPMYTIKCDTLNFELARSHKKVLKRMHNFLRDGVKPKDRSKKTGSQVDVNPKPPKSKQQPAQIDLATVQKKEMATSSSSSATAAAITNSQKMTQRDDKIPPCPPAPSLENQSNFNKKALNPSKKKYARVEKKKAKMLAKGLPLTNLERRYVNKRKTLEEFLSEEPKGGKHRLEVKLILAADGSSNAILELYRKYQHRVHNDPPEKNTKRSYERFLVNSPLQTKMISASAAQGSNINLSFNIFCKFECSVHESEDNTLENFTQFLVTSPLKHRKDESAPPSGWGSFHYQYYLDGELIAVGVIDILPECVSSVYFYYNPEYNFLTLGTYASLREIALTRELNKRCPLLASYYLGFYIPTCPKMRYKANVKPSYLLCPEVYTWHLLDEQLSKEIDSVKYLRINKSGTDRDAATKDDVNDVTCLFSKSIKRYGDLKRMAKSRKSNDQNEVLEYATKVGKSLSKNMLLFRS